VEVSGGSGNNPNLGVFPPIFLFTDAEDRHQIQTTGPWVIKGVVLALEEWRSNFRPQKEKITKAMVWLRMPGLPL